MMRSRARTDRWKMWNKLAKHRISKASPVHSDESNQAGCSTSTTQNDTVTMEPLVRKYVQKLEAKRSILDKAIDLFMNEKGVKRQTTGDSSRALLSAMNTSLQRENLRLRRSLRTSRRDARSLRLKNEMEGEDGSWEVVDTSPTCTCSQLEDTLSALHETIFQLKKELFTHKIRVATCVCDGQPREELFDQLVDASCQTDVRLSGPMYCAGIENRNTTGESEGQETVDGNERRVTTTENITVKQEIDDCETEEMEMLEAAGGQSTSAVGATVAKSEALILETARETPSSSDTAAITIDRCAPDVISTTTTTDPPIIRKLSRKERQHAEWNRLRRLYGNRDRHHRKRRRSDDLGGDNDDYRRRLSNRETRDGSEPKEGSEEVNRERQPEEGPPRPDVLTDNPEGQERAIRRSEDSGRPADVVQGTIASGDGPLRSSEENRAPEAGEKPGKGEASPMAGEDSAGLPVEVKCEPDHQHEVVVREQAEGVTLPREVILPSKAILPKEVTHAAGTGSIPSDTALLNPKVESLQYDDLGSPEPGAGAVQPVVGVVGGDVNPAKVKKPAQDCPRKKKWVTPFDAQNRRIEVIPVYMLGQNHRHSLRRMVKKFRRSNRQPLPHAPKEQLCVIADLTQPQAVQIKKQITRQENDNPVPLTLRPNEVVTQRSQLEKEKEKRKDALLTAIGEFLKVEPNESDGAIMAALHRGLQIQDEIVVLPQVPMPSIQDYLRLQQKVAEQEATIKDLRDVVDKMTGIIKRMESSPQCTLQPAVQSTQSAVAVAHFDNSMDQSRGTERQQPAEPCSHSAASAEKSGRRMDVQPIQANSIKREVEESEQEIGAQSSVECVPTATAGELPTKRRRNTLDVQTVEERKPPSTPRGAGDDIKSQIVLQSVFVAATPRPTAGGSLDWVADAYATPRTPQNQAQSETIEEDDFHSRVGKLALKQRERIVKKIAGFREQNGQSGYSALDLTDLSVNQLNSVQSRLFVKETRQEAHKRRKARKQEKTAASSNAVAEVVNATNEVPLDVKDFDVKLPEDSRKKIASMINC